MKKILAFIMSLVLMCAAGAPVFAASAEPEAALPDSRGDAFITGTMSEIPIGEEDEFSPEYSLMYNGADIDIYGKSANEDGRILVSFETLLTALGADYTYDESTKLLSISKDGYSAVLDIQNKTISASGKLLYSDIPVSDTDGDILIPVRYAAEALGMDIGWDEDFQTAVIMDWDGLYAEIAEKAPALYSFLNYKISFADNSLVSADGKMQLAFDMKYPNENGESKTAKFNLGIDISEEDKYKDDIAESSAVIKLDLAELHKYLEDEELYGDIKIDLGKLSEINMDCFIYAGKLYLKTDLFEQLADISDDGMYSAAFKMVTADTWLSADLSGLLDEYSQYLPASSVSILKTYFEKGNKAFEGMTYMELLKDATGGSECDVITATTAASMVDMYTSMYGGDNFKFTSTGEKGYTMDISIDTDDYLDVYKAQIADMGLSEEEINEAMEMMKESISEYSISASAKTDEDLNSESSVSMNFSMNQKIDEDSYIKIDMTMEMTSTSESGAVTENLLLPEKSVDIMTLLGLAEKFI